MTGSSVALDMAEVASSSGVVGANDVQGADYAFIIDGQHPFHTAWGIGVSRSEARSVTFES